MTWQIHPLGYLDRPGASLLVFHNRYPEGKQGGLELIQHDERVATNGDLWLAPVPTQWGALSQAGERQVDLETGTLRVPLTYSREGVRYSVWARPDGDVLRVGVDLDSPLPEALLGRAGFALELFPGAYGGLPFFLGETVGETPSVSVGETPSVSHGVFPRQANGPRPGPDGPQPLAVGPRLVIAPDDPLRRLVIEGVGGTSLILLDGRDVTHSGWFVVRSPIPPGATALEWRITPNVVESWRRTPVISLSQVGYHPEQAKRAVIELDSRTETPEQAVLLRLTPDSEAAPVLAATPQIWGPYLRYLYAIFDFTAVREPGLYVVRYGEHSSLPFRIGRDVYRQGVWQPTLETFLPVQMCHVAVWDRERVWHGACHLDDACPAPPSHVHFDGYVQGAAPPSSAAPSVPQTAAPSAPQSAAPSAPQSAAPDLAHGGWHDAGDDDLATSSQALTTLILSLAREAFGVDSDQTTVLPDARRVLLHTPDGVPDIVQQIAHGAEFLLAGRRALGHSPMGVIAGDLDQYTRLGDAATTATAARWVFTGRHTSREYQTAAALAAASRALRDHSSDMAAECLEAAAAIWDYEQTHPPVTPDDSYVIGSPGMVEVMATVELLLADGGARYRQRLLALWPAIQANVIQVGWCAARALPWIESPLFARRLQRTLQWAEGLWQSQADKTPFGLPLRFEGTWGVSWELLLQAVGRYYLVRAFPEMFDREPLFRVVNYALGCHPASNLSLVSGVGAQSVTAAYGANRADAGCIPGGVVSGPNLIRPDFPEFKAGFSHLWQQSEYIIYGAAAFLFCVLAAERFLAAGRSEAAERFSDEDQGEDGARREGGGEAERGGKEGSVLPASIPGSAGISPARLARIPVALQRYVDAGRISGLITAVAHCGQTVHLEKIGWMDIEARKPMQFDAFFRIASMTKPVTMIAAMLLYEEGCFTPDTPIAEFIPGFKDVKVFVRKAPGGMELANLARPITFRHLFTHTSGLSYGWDPDDPIDQLYRQSRQESGIPEDQLTLEALVEGLTHLPLAFQPGTKWRYSWAIDVLGYLIEIISGKLLDEFLKKRLFEPLGMGDTDFWLPAAKVDRLTALYGHPDNSPEIKRFNAPADNPCYVKPAFISGGGGLLSTVGDYARFLQLLLNNGELDGERFIAPTTIGLFTGAQASAAALPHCFAQGGGAYNTYFWVDRQKSLYGLLMTQHSPNDYYPLSSVFKQLTYQALGKE